MRKYSRYKKCAKRVVRSILLLDTGFDTAENEPPRLPSYIPTTPQSEFENRSMLTALLDGLRTVQNCFTMQIHFESWGA